MPLWAMSLFQVSSGDRIAAQRVLFLGHRLKVPGIYTGSISTEMIQGHPVWDLTNHQPVRSSVSSPILVVFEIGRIRLPF